MFLLARGADVLADVFEGWAAEMRAYATVSRHRKNTAGMVWMRRSMGVLAMRDEKRISRGGSFGGMAGDCYTWIAFALLVLRRQQAPLNRPGRQMTRSRC